MLDYPTGNHYPKSMSPRQASQIIGADVDTYMEMDLQVAEVNLPDAMVSVRVEGRKDKSTMLRELVQEALEVRKAAVRKRANWRCEECDGIQPLEVHHIIFRSQGRDDRMCNLKALCSECHRRTHRT